MRLLLIYTWSSDYCNEESIFPVIHESPEAAFIDFCESYNNYKVSGGTFKWHGLEFYDYINPNFDIDFKTIDEFFSEVESQ